MTVDKGVFRKTDKHGPLWAMSLDNSHPGTKESAAKLFFKRRFREYNVGTVYES